ncbi:hypothetical protein STCU_07601, partial [Strigomonas culicis]
MTTRPRASIRPPGGDWQGSYFDLDERYRQLQKALNEKDKELRLLKVAQRRATSSTTYAPSSVRARLAAESRQRAGSSPSPPPPSASVTQASVDGAGAALPGSLPAEPREVNMDYVRLAPAAQLDAARAAAINEASMWGPASTLPDPAMVWGAEGSIQNYVAASALFHANEDLRRKLDESTTVIKTLQHELSNTRTLATNAQSRLEEHTQHMHHLIHERDLAVEKLDTAKRTITDFERTLQSRISEEEQVRFSLEAQVTELRSRLVAGADSNDLLSKDVRALLSEVRDKTGEVMSLRSKLALVEAAHASQKSTNENLLVELKGLNSQLIHERKQLVLAARAAQTAALASDRVEDLRAQIHRVTEERNGMEREHVRLMSDFVVVTDRALQHAREEVRQDLADWRAAAVHWEEVAQLLYKDVSQRTQTHIRCREACEEAKAQRDAAAVALRAVRDERAMALAKLRVVWPTHEADTQGLTEEDVLNTFGVKSRFRVRRRAPAAPAAGASAEGPEVDPACLLDFDADAEEEAEDMDVYEECDVSLPPDRTTKAAQIRELHEANAGLAAELEQTRLANDLMRTRLETLTGRRDTEQREVAVATQSLERREVAGQRLLEQQMDRVAFLESQVRSLRGYSVDPGMALETIAPTENVFELFLGQLVAQDVPADVPVPELFSTVFCSADFLLHETVTSPSIRGLNGFFDTTISFRIAMDALLLYYLQTRDLLVQLHRVRREAEVQAVLQEEEHQRSPSGGGSAASSDVHSLRVAQTMYETIAEGRVSLLDIVVDERSREAERPTLRGHVKLVAPGGRHLASLEFQLTARAPLTDEFRQLAREAFTDGVAPPPPQLPRRAAAKKDQRAAARHSVVDWITSSSSSTVERRPAARSGLRLVPTNTNTMGASPPDSYSASSDNSDAVKRRLLQSRPGPPAPPPRQPPAHTPARGTDLADATPPQGQSPPDSLCHLSPGMLGRSPQEASCRVVLDLLRLELPAVATPEPPRLLCYFAVPALHREVRLAAPAGRPRTVEYAPREHAFAVHTLSQLAQLAREPLTFFFLDADGPANSVWALA